MPHHHSHNISVHNIVKSSIVTAFTIAAALIWTDFIREVLGLILPGERLFLKFLAAIIATVFVIVAIYIVLQTESKAEHMLEKLKSSYNNRRR